MQPSEVNEKGEKYTVYGHQHNDFLCVAEFHIFLKTIPWVSSLQQSHRPIIQDFGTTRFHYVLTRNAQWVENYIVLSFGTNLLGSRGRGQSDSIHLPESH
jgi:hypothetical protein